MRFLLLLLIFFAQLTAEDFLAPTTFGGVNALNGNFTFAEEDLCIEGAEPLHLKRFYNSRNTPTPYGGWEFFPHLKLKLFDKQEEYEKEEHNYYLIVAEPTGARITYTRSAEKSGKPIYKIDFKRHGKGIVNCAQTELSARTNLKNNSACRYDKTHIRLYSAGGAVRSYVRLEDHAPEFFLEWEQLPNGNYITYDYYDDCKLKCVCTQNPKRTRTYASATFTYSENTVHVESSDGRTLDYQFELYSTKKPRNDFSLLKQSTGSSKPEEHIDYHYSTHADKLPLVASRKFSKSKFRDIVYYTCQDVEEKDPRFHRVKEVWTSAGPHGARVCSYRFAYSVKEKTYSFVDCRRTEVRDADGNRTVIQFTENLYPARIEYYEKENTLHHVEILEWGACGELEKKTVLDQEEHPFYQKQFTYDPQGNLLEEKLYGNLSGNTPLTFQQKETGYWNPYKNPGSTQVDKNAECRIRRFDYNERNLLIREEDMHGKVITYTYLPGTHLIASKLTHERERIFLREFFEYDADNLLRKSIVDDGRTPDSHNLCDITERKIRCITYNKRGLPETVEEKYWEQGNERLLKKTIFTYSKEGQVEKEEVYDSESTFRYKLETRYNALGLPFFETDPLGRTTISSYDALGNREYIKEPSGKQIWRGYDAESRLESLRERDTDNDERFSEFFYNTRNHLVRAIDPFGYTTLYTPDRFGNIRKIQYPDGSTTSHWHDLQGKEIKTRDARGHVQQTSYTLYGSPSHILYPEGNEERFAYNLDGTLLSAIDQIGTRREYTHDVLGRKRIKKTYAQDGTLLAQETWDYDTFHLKSEMNPNCHTRLYFYNVTGQKTAEKFAGERITYAYDSLQRCTEISNSR